MKILKYIIFLKIFSVAQDYMTKCLKTCDNASTFRLKSNEVTEEELLPLIKSLAYQRNLQVLYMSGGVLFQLGDDLNNMLGQLSNLQELALSGCDIDHDCLNLIEHLPRQVIFFFFLVQRLFTKRKYITFI